VIADKETDSEALRVGLKERLRAQADPTLPISVKIATALPTIVTLNIEIDPRFEAAAVEQAVRQTLFDVDTGILAPKNATIGGSFWTSRLYDVVVGVPGVVSVESGLIAQFLRQPIFVELDPNGAICVPTGGYLDWVDVGIRGVEPVGAVPNLPDRHIGVAT
jgi:hypothetical protein